LCGGALTLTLHPQVLFLDADNMALADPAPLFDARGARDTGALLWPDYWATTSAPDLAAVLGLAALPAGRAGAGVAGLRALSPAPSRGRPRAAAAGLPGCGAGAASCARGRYRRSSG